MTGTGFPIYLDNHATTKLDPRVLEEMMPYLTEKFGNASSMDHAYGHDASVAVESAREGIAGIINARHDEIVFTSGATESDNIALIGTMERYGDRGNHLITCVTEHRAVLDTARHLENFGKKVTYLPVDQYGQVSLDDIQNAITDKTVMISVMMANNEIGTVADVAKIGRLAHDRGVIFHTDAAQTVGHIPVDVQQMNIDLMSFSAHKMYGPKGVGALYIRGISPRIKPAPIIHGGGQERNIRSGTINVPGVVGFGKAAEIAAREMESENKRFRKWNDSMLSDFEKVGGLLNGHQTERLSHNLNVCFPKTEGKAIINSISKEIAISAGSACTAQTVEPSHVILALGYGEGRAHSSVRIGFGRFNEEGETEYCAKAVSKSVESLRGITLNNKS